MWFFKFLLLFKPSPKLVLHYCLIYGMTDEKGRFVQPVNIVQIRAGWGAAERYDGDRGSFDRRTLEATLEGTTEMEGH